MRITYLGNSGFALEHDAGLLILDCFDPARHPLLRAQNLGGYEHVTALISHSHRDHYSPQIWKLENARFAAGYDVPTPAHAVSLHPCEQAVLQPLRVAAYGSTDEGVSFHIQWDGLSIFHAGDLNDWHWRDEGGDEYAREAEDNFLRELAFISDGVEKIDIAFFPVDGRMGSDYYRGAILFCKEMRPRFFMPMHFGTAFTPPPEFYDEIGALTTLLAPPAIDESIVCAL